MSHLCLQVVAVLFPVFAIYKKAYLQTIQLTVKVPYYYDCICIGQQLLLISCTAIAQDGSNYIYTVDSDNIQTIILYIPMGEGNKTHYIMGVDCRCIKA